MDVESVAGEPGCRSQFWCELSWRVGDEHATRICRWIDVYCRIYKLGKARFPTYVPR